MDEYSPRFGGAGDIGALVLIVLFGLLVGIGLSVFATYTAVEHGALDSDFISSSSH